MSIGFAVNATFVLAEIQNISLKYFSHSKRNERENVCSNRFSNILCMRINLENNYSYTLHRDGGKYKREKNRTSLGSVCRSVIYKIRFIRQL